MRIALAAGLLAASSSLAWSAAYDSLRPHRAVYDVVLEEVSDRSGIRGIQGRIVYEFTGSACDGFSTRYRFVTQVETGRKSFVSDERTTTFEGPDGKSFNFVNQSYLNGQLERDVRGDAVTSDDATVVTLKKPEELESELPPATFSTTHVARIIEAARKGERLLKTTLFDGSGDADDVTETLAVVGEPIAVDERPKSEGAEVAEKLEGQEPWPATVSYFDDDVLDGGGERTPVYEVSFKLYPSGVTRDLTMRFRDYTLRGAMQELEFLPVSDCD